MSRRKNWPSACYPKGSDEARIAEVYRLALLDELRRKQEMDIGLAFPADDAGKAWKYGKWRTAHGLETICARVVECERIRICRLSA